ILFLNQWFQRIWNSRLLHALFCSIFAGAAALVLNRWGLCEHADKVIIGDIMLLIPGIALTNALRDLFAGDTISGLLRLLEALLQAGAIACGFALSVYLGGILL
ncbi:MAG: threonine/serine exporter family protein, partial [Eubacteriales bacterium]|nr:threonine/serine exporter family protein [Eubacteriales bacterium]